jgi:hypothetical protein
MVANSPDCVRAEASRGWIRERVRWCVRGFETGCRSWLKSDVRDRRWFRAGKKPLSRREVRGSRAKPFAENEELSFRARCNANGCIHALPLATFN